LVVVEIEGVVKEVPVPREAPPVEAAYQLSVPAEALAPSVTVPVPQRLAGVFPVMVGIGLMVAATAVRDTERQPLLLASAK
jgi:hypothetical protein